MTPQQLAAAGPIRLTWLITILGCLAGVVMIVIVWLTLAHIRGERQQLERFKAGVLQSRARIDQELLAAKENVYSLLFAEAPAVPADEASGRNLRALVREYGAAVANPAAGGDFAALEQAVAALEDIGQRSRSWTEQRAEMQVQLAASRHRVEEALGRLDELVQKTYGRKRLERASRIRQYRRAAGGQSAALGRQLVAELATMPDLSVIRRDLADLAVLCERLRSEQRRDFLADLKDNRIRTVLARLRRNMEITPDLEAGRVRLVDFETALFGTGYVIENEYQTVITGVGGMFGFMLNHLALVEEGEELRLEAANRFDAAARLLQELSGRVESMVGERAVRVEDSLRIAWRTMFLLWLVTGTAFVLISARIIRAVRRQVRAIEDANAALLASREGLRESEEQLHRLSSSLLTAQERERRRIARELHDELGQAMAALKLQVRAAERTLGDQAPPALKDECRSLRQTINEIIENMRRLSRDLCPVVLEDLGFEAAVEYLTSTFAGLHGIQVELEKTEISHLLSQEAQHNAYRILQELLNNVGKHAGATRVRVAIAKSDADLIFTVEDDGRGFDAAQVKKVKATEKGMGLTAVAERVRLLGGRLDIRSQPARGTAVTVTVPLQVLSSEKWGKDGGVEEKRTTA